VLALVDVLVPLIAALVALMPGEDTWRVGYLVMGVVGLGALVWHAATYLRHEPEARTFDDRLLQLGLPLSLGACFGVVVFSAKGDGPSPYVVAALSLGLVLSGATKAWLLLGQGSGAGEDDESLGRPGHRDVAVDRAFDPRAEGLRVDEHHQVELEPLRQLRGQRPDPRA
jgi:hypothetical protein